MATQIQNAIPVTVPQASTAATTTAPQFASLYVGDLSPEVTEAMLYETFNSVGPVASIRVCRDSVTRRSLGYAYVNFHSVSDAERALDTLNYTLIKGKACRIMWSHRDPALRRSGNGNVFVKNLDKTIDNKSLFDAFSIFGNILSCKVSTDADGKSRGFGFVHFETDEAATSAIEKMNNAALGDKNIYVGYFKKTSERETTAPKNFTNVYIKQMPNHWDDQKIKEVFSSFGEITSMVIQRDGKGRRFAFVNYKDFDSARNAVNELHGQDFRTDEEKAADEETERTNAEERKAAEAENGRKPVVEDTAGQYVLYVTRAQTRGEREAELKNKFNALNNNTTTQAPSGVNLYVKNLSEDLDDEGLRELFAAYGPISSVKVMRDDRGMSKGFGFVCFASSDDATKAVTEMHLKLINNKPLYVGMHEKREQRIERLQTRYQVAGALGQPTPNSMLGGAGMRSGLGQMGGAYGAQQMYGQQPQQQQSMFYNQVANAGMMNRAGGPQGMMGPGGMVRQPGMMGAAYPGAGSRFPTQMAPTVGGMNPGAGYPNPMMANRAMAARPRPAGLPMMNAASMQQQMVMGGARPMPQQMAATAQAAAMGMNPYLSMHPNARNMGGMMMGGMPQQRPPMDPHAATALYDLSAGAPLTAAALAAAPPSLQKQMLGEKLFPSIQRIQPELAGKITGMMLEMDNTELLILLESEQQLRAKVAEAMRVLEDRE